MASFALHGIPVSRGIAIGRAHLVGMSMGGMIAQIVAGTWCGSYDCAERDNVRDALGAHREDVVGKRGLVLGSERPWIEILSLNLGAAEVWTMEYATIESTHPQLITRTNRELAVAFLDGSLPEFDFVVSFSSIEHSGLGRYGDALNPDGDAEAMRQARCFLKPGGLMLLGFPMTCREDGFIEFNAHRVYGNERLRYITQGFATLGWENGGCEATNARSQQPLVALRKQG